MVNLIIVTERENKMEEKILIKSTHYSLKGKLKLILIVAIAIALVIMACNAFDNLRYVKKDYLKVTTQLTQYNYDDLICSEHLDEVISGARYVSDIKDKFKDIHPNFISYAHCVGVNLFDDGVVFSFIPLGLFLIILLIECWLSSFSLTVTNIRAYGKIPGKRVDLPIDSVSSVSTSMMKGISIGTSSGQINFKCVKNQEEVHKVISELLIKRNQENKSEDIRPTNHTEELVQLKNLLDSGVITQEDFDAKKKQILGL